jgi:hypothetical protein
VGKQALVENSAKSKIFLLKCAVEQLSKERTEKSYCFSPPFYYIFSGILDSCIKKVEVITVFNRQEMSIESALGKLGT